MEDGLKQRIYENILRFLENYRYIKSTAEATIPNFIAFCISRHWILTYRQSISHIVHLFKAADGWRAYIRCKHERVTVKSPLRLPYGSQKGLESYYTLNLHQEQIQKALTANSSSKRLLAFIIYKADLYRLLVLPFPFL